MGLLVPGLWRRNPHGFRGKLPPLLGGEFDPSTIWSLYWEADEGTSLTSGEVTQWVDQIQGKTVSQGNSSFYPSFDVALPKVNGQPALNFDGTDDFLSDGSGLVLGTGSWTFAAVFTTSTTSTGNERIVAQNTAGSALRVGHRNGVLRVSVQSENGETIVLDSTTAINDGGLHRCRVAFDGDTKTLTMFLDGVEEGSGTNVNLDTISYHSQFQIGAESGIRNWNGEILAVAYRTDRRLTPAEVEEFDEYATNKWFDLDAPLAATNSKYRWVASTLDSGPVSSWTDQISDVELTQGLAIKPELIDTDPAFNNEPSVFADGDDLIDSPISPNFGTGDWEIWFVYETEDQTTDARVFFHLNDSAGNTSIRIQKRFSGNFQAAVTNDAGTSVTPSHSITIDDGIARTGRLRYDSSTGDLTFSTDGVEEAAGNLSGSTFTVDTISLFARSDGSKNIEGSIAELVIADGLFTADELLALDDYAADKYGVEVKWNPDDLDSGLYWWRADLGNTLDGSNNVTALVDQISGVELIPGVAGTEPAYIASNADFNGQPTIRGDGTDERLATSISQGFENDWEFVFVWRTDDTTSTNQIGCHFYGGGADITHRKLNTSIDARLDDDAGNATQNAYTTVGNTAVARIRFDSSTREVNWYINGSLNRTRTLAGSGDFPVDTLKWFEHRNGSSQLNGDIAEMIVANKLMTSEELTELDNYMVERYGLNV